MGAIGIGGQGMRDMLSMMAEPGVIMTDVCDVRRSNRENARDVVNAKYNNQDCRAHVDFRDLLARKEIDAVVIATGDRWHALASILAMRAGKDVYCEKPGCLGIHEGRALVETASQTQRVFQTGAQRASESNYILAGELLRLGRLGNVHTVRAHLGYLPQWPRRNSVLPEQPLPPRDELDWDIWLGPSPARPYNAAFLSAYPAPGWYTQPDFAAGIAQWGSHTILQCQLALGLGETSATEYHYPENLQREGMKIRFANGITLVAQCSGWSGSCGVRYEGDSGWVSTADGYARPEVSSPTLLDGARDILREYTERTGRVRNHRREFLDRIRDRKTTVTGPQVAYRTMTTNLIMDMCLDSQRNLRWDPEKEEFPDDPQANALRARPMRAPWSL